MAKTAMVAAAALLGAGVAAAQSAVTVYGVMDIYGGRTVNEAAAGETRTTLLNSGGLTTSYIGFRGTEDLGGGLKALFALESYIRVDTGQIGRNDSDPFFGRASWVGLEGGAGRILLGRIPTPYSLATTNWTPLPGTTTFSPAFAAIFRNNVLGDTRSVNTVAYKAPRFAGVEVDVQYSFGQENPKGPNHKRDAAWDGSLKYFAGPLSLVAATRRIDLNANNNGQKQVADMAGAMYDFGVAKLSGQYHRVRDTQNNAARDATRKSAIVGASVPVGPGAIVAEYARSKFEDSVAASPAARRTYVVGYDHNLSKRTDAYILFYSDTLKDPGSRQRTAAIGLRHRF